MFDKIKNLFGKKPVIETPKPIKEKKPRKPRKPKQPEPQLTAKELATKNGEPYIHIVKMELDPSDVNNGAFELDWNDKFLANLVRAGYQKEPNEPEHVIVDRWFQSVCRNVVMEYYEQEQADPDIRRINRRDLGKGRSEIS